MEEPMDGTDNIDARAWPRAGPELTNSVGFSCCEQRNHDEPYQLLFKQILELVQQASQYQQVKKGANEGICTSLWAACMIRIDI